MSATINKPIPEYNRLLMPCGFGITIRNLVLELAHAKRKRCLAMASTCRLHARWFGNYSFYKKEQWALKWHRRWLELAEYYTED